MEIVKPSFMIEEDALSGWEILKRLERFGRTCYKSEKAIGPKTAAVFVGQLIASGHESVLEHEKVTVRVICDRGISHEIVRHRIAAYSQESTRYCNYRAKGVRFIEPFFFLGTGNEAKYATWLAAMTAGEEAYLKLIELGATPQEARTVLPNSLKTEIVITYNLREWRHFFRLRVSPQAHPQMREITIPMLQVFKRAIPVVFDDIKIA